MLQSRPLLLSALGEPSVEATRDPAPPPRSRFDIESLLAKPDPPRRSAPGTSVWTAAAAASPGALRYGCAVRFLPVPAVCLGERPPALLPLPPRQCAPSGCRRPELEMAPCPLAGSLGAPSLSWRSGGPCKMKRVRTVFTPEQLDRLEKEFLKQQYMVGNERVDLAATLRLTETQVKVWFQNRRIKWRKQSLEQKAAKLSQFGGPQPLAQGLPDEEDSGENEEGDVDIEV